VEVGTDPTLGSEIPIYLLYRKGVYAQIPVQELSNESGHKMDEQAGTI
jgi:hypothetical protein